MTLGDVPPSTHQKIQGWIKGRSNIGRCTPMLQSDLNKKLSFSVGSQQNAPKLQNRAHFSKPIKICAISPRLRSKLNKMFLNGFPTLRKTTLLVTVTSCLKIGCWLRFHYEHGDLIRMDDYPPDSCTMSPTAFLLTNKWILGAHSGLS